MCLILIHNRALITVMKNICLDYRIPGHLFAPCRKPKETAVFMLSSLKPSNKTTNYSKINFSSIHINKAPTRGSHENTVICMKLFNDIISLCLFTGAEGGKALLLQIFTCAETFGTDGATGTAAG